MPKGKSCKPSAKVRKAGETLSTSTSKKAKTEASQILNDHKKTNH